LFWEWIFLGVTLVPTTYTLLRKPTPETPKEMHDIEADISRWLKLVDDYMRKLPQWLGSDYTERLPRIREEPRARETGRFIGRGRFEIVNSILLASLTPARKTQIVHRANLSNKQLRRYLDVLLQWEVLKTFEKEGRIFYQITDKGKQFTDEHRRLMEFRGLSSAPTEKMNSVVTHLKGKKN